MVIWVPVHILSFEEVYGGWEEVYGDWEEVCGGWDEMVKGPLGIKG